MNRITAGCLWTTLTEDEGRVMLNGILGAEAPQIDPDLRWLLAYCHDGVVWGRREGDSWQLACEAFPEVSPRPQRRNLLEARLFGPQAEILLWQAEGAFHARRMATQSGPEGHPLAPKQETYLVRGDRVLAAARNGFTLVGDASGSRQAVPLRCGDDDLRQGQGLRLEVCHYLEQDPESGVVRVAASRLVDLKMGSEEETP